MRRFLPAYLGKMLLSGHERALFLSVGPSKGEFTHKCAAQCGDCALSVLIAILKTRQAAAISDLILD